jgi:hypothetical protein
MTKFIIKISALLCFCIFTAVPFSPQALAHGNLSMEDDRCVLKLGPYLMHFTGYQPQVDPAKEFCEDIPAVGEAIVVFDFVDEPLRKMDVGLKIVEDIGDGTNDGKVFFEIPSQLFPVGSVSAELAFEKPGKFIGLVTVDRGNGQEQITARFPFAVGLVTDKSTIGYTLWFLGAILFGAFLYFRMGKKGSGLSSI